jgi:hypothetical protein
MNDTERTSVSRPGGNPRADNDPSPLAEHTDRRAYLAELRLKPMAAEAGEGLTKAGSLVDLIVEIAGEAWDDGHNVGYPAAENDVRGDMEGYLRDLQRCCHILGDENFDTTRFLVLYAEKCRRRQ